MCAYIYTQTNGDVNYISFVIFIITLYILNNVNAIVTLKTQEEKF